MTHDKNATPGKLIYYMIVLLRTYFSFRANEDISQLLKLAKGNHKNQFYEFKAILIMDDDT
jgi:hypothetical protein